MPHCWPAPAPLPATKTTRSRFPQLIRRATMKFGKRLQAAMAENETDSCEYLDYHALKKRLKECHETHPDSTRLAPPGPSARPSTAATAADLATVDTYTPFLRDLEHAIDAVERSYWTNVRVACAATALAASQYWAELFDAGVIPAAPGSPIRPHDAGTATQPAVLAATRLAARMARIDARLDRADLARTWSKAGVRKILKKLDRATGWGTVVVVLDRVAETRRFWWGTELEEARKEVTRLRHEARARRWESVVAS
ncbi:hypothetical protein AMAG_01041 [Allomyces macrogynus ATCC 38327]|uniref:SPX domain-containing protein n=1 Tax=Allomyces macrogynus (strain ATCC 38327) TaxID=578462 RepID=A0A0L0RYE9_ALLM3|nr:hypothetical protein AMAG_01041 [Allomyces macrogynus ATCC 38327]|eukprot:KNE55109.1 hypothetical protein AMAG_01041 [Allomyces macrogynus ATCC 38327]